MVLSPAQVQSVTEAFGSVVGGHGGTAQVAAAPIPTSSPRQLVQPFKQSAHLFLAAAAQGMPVPEALRAFAQVDSGHFSASFRRSGPWALCRTGPASSGVAGVHELGIEIVGLSFRCGAARRGVQRSVRAPGLPSGTATTWTCSATSVSPVARGLERDLRDVLGVTLVSRDRALTSKPA